MIILEINKQPLELTEDSLRTVCINFKKRIIKLLYLKEENLSTNNINSYIDSLIIDLYGFYKLTSNDRVLNVLCELEGLKHNIEHVLFRKKVLDVANFIANLY